eukprot:3458045-Rhodomonas_salina.1
MPGAHGQGRTTWGTGSRGLGTRARDRDFPLSEPPLQYPAIRAIQWYKFPMCIVYCVFAQNLKIAEKAGFY